jgi:protein TonB
MRQEAGEKSVLFASILDAHAPQAERRARLLRWVPFSLALHILAVLVLARGWQEAAPPPIRAEDDAPVIKLLAAPRGLPSAVAAAARPVQAVTRRVVARKKTLRLQPAPLPTRAPEAEEPPPLPEAVPEADDAPSSPLDTSEAEGGAISANVAEESVEGAAAGGVLGGILGGVLSNGIPPPPALTPEEREAMVERYAEMLIRARFRRMRYPHQAAAAGIKGEVLLRVSISAQGRVLELEQIGRCPHPLLCDSALEAVRKAEPFPPPPPELGNPFILELPFRYRLH